MREITPFELEGNVFDMIGKQWMLISAGDETASNTMTASWGGLGVLWGKPVATCYIRPTRHTYGFTEQCDRFTLAFLGEEYRPALNLCGKASGRDMDKWQAAGLTPAYLEGTVYPAEAKLVLVCRKQYVHDLEPAHFLDPDIHRHYDNDYHRMYIGEIERVLVCD